MSPERTKDRRALGLLGMLLNRPDRVYSLSLLVPFVVYNLALKAYAIASRPGSLDLARAVRLMRSDVFFNLGYASLWVGLFAAARGWGTLGRVVVLLFHVATVVVAAIRTAAHQYFRETGTTLDYDIIAIWILRYEEIKPMLKAPLLARVFVAASLLYTTLGPWVSTRTIGRRRGWPERPLAGTSEGSSAGTIGPLLLALAAGLLSLPTGPVRAGESRSFTRDPFVNVLVTGIKEVRKRNDANAGGTVEHPAANAILARTPRMARRNVVLVHLESTRASSATPYNEDLKTTPFLDELVKSSLLVERAYTVIPNTLKASVAVNCGIEPRLRPGAEAKPGEIPAPCLAGLLRKEDYRSVLFQSSTENFENFRDLAKNLGYEDYYPVEAMDTKGFERPNYFGYEDDVMLKPSEDWLKENRGRPFVAEYLTGAAHHDYTPPTRYGIKDFSEDDRLNRYLNCVRYQDFFLRNLFEQYKRLGLYEDTIFVIFGDHGEGFGEHGRYVHEDNPYEVSLRVPLVIHAPGRFEGGERVEGLSNLTDILPTILDLLGYEVKNGEYPGYSLLRAIPEDRTLMFSCFYKDKCLASIRGNEKYIHHYGNQPDELFDLSKDPCEEHNLADERAREAEKRREELLAWRASKRP